MKIELLENMEMCDSTVFIDRPIIMRKGASIKNCKIYITKDFPDSESVFKSYNDEPFDSEKDICRIEGCYITSKKYNASL